MKIKLRDYSLINNEWIDKEIDRLERIKKESDVTDYSIVGQLISLIKLKEQLISAEKLAESCLDKIIETMPPALAIHYLEYKKDFIKSEIEIQ
jgi:hypothetical protein